MSEAKCSITEAKCLQISHNKYASQRDAISHSMGNLMLSHSTGMRHPDISIAGICPNKFERAKGSERFHFASLHYIFSAYLPTHIKFLTEFLRIFFGTTCKSFPYFICPPVLASYFQNYLPKSRKISGFGKVFQKLSAKIEKN
ncbi:MAG: hypothetical protein SPJ46_10115, partial [Sodaliphilus sp.]|nr:hypothetical protein [Sodaliphilus sp.]